MEFFKKIFRRRKQFKPQPKELRIDGCKTSMTAAPDDSELAAQALLETKTEVRGERPEVREKKPQQGTVEYYRDLSEKIKESHEHDARMAMRYVAYAEEKIEELKNSKIKELQSFNSSILPSLERGLYKHQNTVEREGGELLRRWQKCLAECIMRQMVSDENKEENEKE